MTSKSLYSAEQKSALQVMLSKRPVLIALSAISLLAYFPVRTLLMLSSLSNGYRSYLFTDGGAPFGLYLSSSKIAPILAVLLGIYAGIEGFAWVFSSKKTDFYEALPISRKNHFRYIFFSGFLIFAGFYLIAMILTLFIAAVTGMLNGSVLIMALFSLLRDMSAFLAAYGTAVLSAMLTGSLFYAVFMCGFILCIGAAFVIMLREYMLIYFSTFAGGFTALPAPLSVPWHIERLSRIGNASVYENIKGAFDGLRFLRDGAPHFCGMLALAFITTFAAALLFRKRKVELAGGTVIHYPVQVAVKFLAAIVGGMTLGILVENMFRHDSFVYLAIVVLGITGLICIIMEMLYKRSVRSGLMSLLHVPVVMAITYIMLLFFRLDICSYDRFVPTPEKVESYAVITDISQLGIAYSASYDQFLTDEGKQVSGSNTFALEYMYLTNVSDMEALAQAVLAAADERELEDDDRQAENPYNEQNYYDCVILYRMKSGRQVYRRMRIPCDTDKELLAAVIETDEYKFGAYQIYHADSLVETFDNKEGTMFFDSGFDVNGMSAAGKVDELLTAYAEDMKGLTFDELQNAQMAGRLSLYLEKETVYNAVRMPVYQSFENTIEFLRKNGIYSETDPKELDVNCIIVSRSVYYNEDGMESYDWLDHEYTEPRQIEQIRESVVYTEFLSPWYNRDLLEPDYFIDEYSFKTETRTDMAFTYAQRSLLKEKIPAFVREDLGE